MLLRFQFRDRKIDHLIRATWIAHVNQFREPPRPNRRFDLRNQFWKRGQIRDCRRSEPLGFGESFVDRSDVIFRRKLRLLRIDCPDPVGERFLPRNFAAQTSVIEMAMRVDQPRQQRLVAKIDNFLTRMSLQDVGKFSNIEDPLSRNRDSAAFDRLTVHGHHVARANDHSLVCALTTLRHSATSKLHAS